jgi:hypothetical protein
MASKLKRISSDRVASYQAQMVITKYGNIVRVDSVKAKHLQSENWPMSGSSSGN